MSSKLCCGIPLRKGAKIVAITDIAAEIITMAFMIVSLVGVIREVQMQNSNENKYHDHHTHDTASTTTNTSTSTNIAIIALDSSSLLIHIVEFLIIGLVYQGAQQSSTPKCRIWVRITEALTTLDGIIFVAHMILSFDVGMLVFMLLDLSYKSYSAAVVEAFLREMRAEGTITTRSADERTELK